MYYVPKLFVHLKLKIMTIAKVLNENMEKRYHHTKLCKALMTMFFRYFDVTTVGTSRSDFGRCSAFLIIFLLSDVPYLVCLSNHNI